MSIAVYLRRLQFRAGPQSHWFAACREHREDIQRGDYSGVFFPAKADDVQAIGEDDEMACDWCREG